MAVGAGSIKRAAKVSEKTEQNTCIEKMVSGKKEASKDTELVKKTGSKKVVVKNMEKSVNQVCHITEDLPIYLL